MVHVTTLRTLLLTLVVAVPATAESILLPVPGAGESSREKINLAVTIPARTTPKPEEPARERIRSSALQTVDWSPFKTVPQKKFVYDTLRIFRRKGVLRMLADTESIENETDIFPMAARTVVRTYERLALIHRKEALKRFGIEPTDLERFQRVVDIFAPYFVTYNAPVAEVNKNLDAMIDSLKKTGGRGQIRITGLREQKDGSTLVEMEILRAPEYNR